MKLALLASLTIATAANAQSCTFGAYQCSGSTTLQQCTYGAGNVLSWTTAQTCSSGTVCSVSGYIGCIAGSAGATSTTATAVKTKTTAAATTAKAVTSTAAVTTTVAKPTTTTVAVATTTQKVVPTTTPVVVATSTSGGAVPPVLGAPCSPFGASACANSVTYQCAYNSASVLQWAQWYTGACPGATTTGSGPVTTATAAVRPFTTPGIIGYWTNWSPYSRAENAIDTLDLTNFTTINYAFVNVSAAGALVSFDPVMDATWLPKFNGVKAKYPNLRTVVSLGGWSGSTHFSTIAASASLIQTFANNVLAYLVANNFDGVDIDWEYPGGGGITCNAVNSMDAANFVTLLSVLRATLGPQRSISIAASALASRYIDGNGVNQIPNMMKYINYAQLMSYDFYGSWVPYSDFNSALDVPGPTDPQEPATNNKAAGYPEGLTQKASVALWLAAGANASQLTNGLAFYGRSWSVQSNTNNGLYQLCTGSVLNATSGMQEACPGIVGDYLDKLNSGPGGTWCDPCGSCYFAGVWMYNNLRGETGGGDGVQASPPLASGPTTGSNGWNRQYFNFAQSPTLYTSSYNGASSFISYDDPVSIQAKAAWAKSAGLGGTMIWELSQDYNTELVNAVRAGWGN
ncbi:hypothetical protein HDU98_001644 [Podochytrium sp. JEL0797]|nr:hypothetical protein HDU98_001644 [Podochytrium sp. JEL0797]